MENADQHFNVIIINVLLAWLLSKTKHDKNWLGNGRKKTLVHCWCE
jgi:hypothetical protein